MHPALETYISLCDFLGAMYGAQTEIALCELSASRAQIVYLVHGYVSGREVGDSPSAYLIHQYEEFQNRTDIFPNPISTQGLNNELLYTGIYFIRDESNSIIGALAINRNVAAFQNLEDSLNKLIDAYIPGGSEDAKRRGLQVVRNDQRSLARANLVGSSAVVIHDAIAQACSALGADPAQLSTEQRIRLFQLLDSNGIFKIKGAVSEVARELNISDPTVYRCLRLARRA